MEPAVPGTPAPAAVAALPATPAMLSKLSSNAWFCTGSSELTATARADLLKSIETFRPHAKEPMVVHAFADTRGTSVYNLALSGARARVVADFLRANGLTISASEGKGELDGLADKQNCANQRRADIFFKSGSDLRPCAACMPPPEASAPVCR
jgi:outer membrane protein OmpA-like peptidoglycan-associated protein